MENAQYVDCLAEQLIAILVLIFFQSSHRNYVLKFINGKGKLIL